jgi:tripartite-type tricarboxylate transporter receptor subunit TctC
MKKPRNSAPRPGLSRRLLLQGASAALVCPQARAQAAWPTRGPVTLVVPFPSGGGTDAFARPLASALSRSLGNQVVLESRGGAGGIVGASLAAKSAPDGYTFFMGAVHHTIAPSLYPKLDYDLESDFVPVALVSSVPQVLIVNPHHVAVNDLKSLVELVRKHPARYSYGSAGNGTSHHLAGELFKLQTKTVINHNPYRGAGPALQDLIGGRVDMMFDGLGSSSIHIKSGRVRALAVASFKRAPGLPTVPTFAEAGLPDYQVATWYGLWAPRGTPRDIVERMQVEMAKAFATPELQATWNQLGAEAPNLYGEAFGRFVRSEIKRWAEVARNSGAKLDCCVRHPERASADWDGRQANLRPR